MIRNLLAFVVAMPLAALASAQVSPTGPFTGAVQETFETQNHSGFQPCIQGRVFNNQADLCTPGTSGCSITGGWGYYCQINPQGGFRLCGSSQGYMEYTFDSAAQRFGGYFGNNTNVNDGLAVFFDASNNLLGSFSINAPANCSWNWNGWDAGSGAPIKRVEIYGPTGFYGGFMMMDEMELDPAASSPGVDMCQPGQAGVLACPCSNPPAGAPRGCDNSSATGGAQLTSTGTASLANDTVVFSTNGERPTATSIVLQGNMLLGSGLNFGMGVRCTGGVLKRLYVETASGGSITAPLPGYPSVSARSATLGDTIFAGTQRYYAVYYRDPNVLGGCFPTNTYNITQTQQVLWNP